MPAPHPSLPPTEDSSTARPSFHLNWEDWLPYLEDSDATEAEKQALIETLWNILVGFIDLGWEVADGEKISGKDVDLSAVLRAAVVQSAESSDPDNIHHPSPTSDGTEDAA